MLPSEIGILSTHELLLQILRIFGHCFPGPEEETSE